MNNTFVIMEKAKYAFDAGNFPASMNFIKQAFDADFLFQQQEAVQYVCTFPVDYKGQFWRAPEELFKDSVNVKDIFGEIYEKAIWGGGSGCGSDISRTIIYAAYVQHLMERYSVETIVDIGCGDWRFSKYLNFDGRQYLGIDVVESVISTNMKQYGNKNVVFQFGNATEFEIPKCDLLLCKDVLQHLSNNNVNAILQKSVVATRALFTNDYHPVNEDCRNGDTRPLNITSAPFSVAALPRLAFQGKVTFLVDNSKPT